MNKIIVLSVVTKNPVGLIRYVQYSTEIPLEFCLTDYPIPARAVGNLYIKKPSGLEVYNAGKIVGNSVVVHPTVQLFAETGEQEGQLQIIADGKILMSFLLRFCVEKNIIEDSAAPSTNQYTALDKLVTDAQQTITRAEDAAVAANTAANAATAAAGDANVAASAATSGASSANTAASAANAAAGKANTAANIANEAAETAGNAATRANTAAEAVEEIVSNFLNKVYPVGSIYMSIASTNPQTLLGGTWVAWGAGRVPVGVASSDSDFSAANKTGGEKTHALTIDEIPSHAHYLNNSNASGSTGNYALTYIPDSKVLAGTLKTSPSGGGSAHNNMPPYVTCYMWRRTA